MRRARATHVFVTQKDRIESDRLRRRELEEGEATSEETLKGSVIKVVDSTETSFQEDVELERFRSFYSRETENETETIPEEDQPSFRRLSPAPGRIVLNSDEAIAGPSRIQTASPRPELSETSTLHGKELSRKRGPSEEPRETLIDVKRKSNLLNITNRFVDKTIGNELQRKIIRRSKQKHKKRSIFCYREQERRETTDTEDTEDDKQTIKEVTETDEDTHTETGDTRTDTEDTRTETEDPRTETEDTRTETEDTRTESDVEYLAKKETEMRKSPTASNKEVRPSLDMFKRLKELMEKDPDEILDSDALQREDVIYSPSPKDKLREPKRKRKNNKSDVATELKDLFIQDTPKESMQYIDDTEDTGTETQSSAVAVSCESGDVSQWDENSSNTQHEVLKNESLKVSGAQGQSKVFTSKQKYAHQDPSRGPSATQQIEKCSKDLDLFRDSSCYCPENAFSEDITDDDSNTDYTCPSFKQLKLPVSPQFASKVFPPGVIIHSSPATSCFKKQCLDNITNETNRKTIAISADSSVEISSGWFEESSEADAYNLVPPVTGKIFTSKGCYCSLSQCEGPKIADKSKDGCSNPDCTIPEVKTSKIKITSENVESVITQIIASREKRDLESMSCTSQCYNHQKSLSKQKIKNKIGPSTSSKSTKIGQKKSSGVGKKIRRFPTKDGKIPEKQSGTSKKVEQNAEVPSKRSSQKRTSFSTTVAVKKPSDEIKDRHETCKKNVGKTTSAAVTSSKIIRSTSKLKGLQKKADQKSPQSKKNIKPGTSNIPSKPGTSRLSFKKKTGDTTSSSTTDSKPKKSIPKLKNQKKNLLKPAIRPCKPKPCLKCPKKAAKLSPCAPRASSCKKINKKQAIPIKLLDTIGEEKRSASLDCKQIDNNTKIENKAPSASRILKDTTSEENKTPIPQKPEILPTSETTKEKPEIERSNKDTETSFLELEIMLGSKDPTLNKDFVSDEVLIRDIDMEQCFSSTNRCKVEVQTDTKEEIGITTSNVTGSKNIQLIERDLEKEAPQHRDVQIVASVRSFVNLSERQPQQVYQRPRRLRWRFERQRKVNEFIFLKAPVLHQPATNVFYQAPPSIDRCIQYDAPEMDIEEVFRPEVRKPKYPKKNKRKVTFKKKKKENQWKEVWNCIAHINKSENYDSDDDETRYSDEIGEGAIVDDRGNRLFVVKRPSRRLHDLKKISECVIKIGGNVFQRGWECGREKVKSLLDLSLSGIDKLQKSSFCKSARRQSQRRVTKKISNRSNRSNESAKVSQPINKKRKNIFKGKKKNRESGRRVRDKLLENIFGSSNIHVRSSTLKSKQDSEESGTSTTRKRFPADKKVIALQINESQKRDFQNISEEYPLHSEVRIMPFTGERSTPINTKKDPHVLRGLRELNFPKESTVIKISTSDEGLTECLLEKDKVEKPAEIELREILEPKGDLSLSNKSSVMSKDSKGFPQKYHSKGFKERTRVICGRVFMGLKNSRAELLSWFRQSDRIDPDTPSQDELNEHTLQTPLMKTGQVEEEAPITGMSSEQRRVDFVLALNIIDPPEAESVKLDMLTAIAKTGVHMETELGTLKQTRKYQFVKLTAPDTILKKYGCVLNVLKFFGESHLKHINSRWTGLDQLARARYEREWLRAIRKQYTLPMKMSNLERSYVVYMLLRQLRFGPARNYVGLHRLLRNSIVVKAYAMHDGPYYKPTQFDYSKFNARQLLFLNWGQNFFPSMAGQPLHIISEYFGSKLGFYFAFYEFYNRALLFAAIWGVLMMFAFYAKSGQYLDFTLYHLCKKPRPYFLVQRKPSIPFELNYHLDYKSYQVAAECEPSDPPQRELVPNDNRTRCPYQYVNNVCGDLKLMQWFDHPYLVVYSFGMAVWALLFQRLWKRTESYYAWMWEESLCPPLATPRLEYTQSKRDPGPKRMVDKFKSFGSHVGKGSITGFLVPAIIVFITVLLTVLVFMYAYINMTKPYVVSKTNDVFMTIYKTLDYVFLVLWTLLILVALTILEWIFHIVAEQLVDFENHKYFEDYENSLLQKVFTYSFVIISAPIVYFAWIKGSFYYSPIESYNNFRIVSPWGEKHKISQTNFTQRFISQNCNPFSCFRQAVVVFITTVLFRFGIISVFFNNIRHSSYSPRWGAFMKPSSVEREFLLPDPQTDVDVVFDINRLMVQFAVITLFAPLCPLAPIIAIFVNMLHFRSKTKELVVNTKRPVLFKAQGLGAWNFIIKLICYGVPLFHGLTITHTEIFRRYLTYKTEVSLPNEWGRSNPMHREFKFAHMMFLGRFNVTRAHESYHDHFQFLSAELKTMTNCCLDSMIYQTTNLTKKNTMWPNQPMLMKDRWTRSAPLPAHYYSRYLKVAYILAFLHIMAAIGSVLWYNLPSPRGAVSRLRYRERALRRMRCDRLRFTQDGDQVYQQAK